MQTYLAIQVPISFKAHWFKTLRDAMQGIPVRWQDGCFHITMAFCDETPADKDLIPVLEKHLSKASAPELCFDKLGAFRGSSGMDYIYLGVTQIPLSFTTLVENIREDLKAEGCVMQSDFKLHVTLGRVKDDNTTTECLQVLTSMVPLPHFTLTPTVVDYRVFRGDSIYKMTLRK